MNNTEWLALRNKLTNGHDLSMAESRVLLQMTDENYHAGIKHGQEIVMDSLTELTEAALDSLGRIKTEKLAALGRDQDAECVGNARRFLDRTLVELQMARSSAPS